MLGSAHPPVATSTRASRAFCGERRTGGTQPCLSTTEGGVGVHKQREAGRERLQNAPGYVGRWEKRATTSPPRHPLPTPQGRSKHHALHSWSEAKSRTRAPNGGLAARARQEREHGVAVLPNATLLSEALYRTGRAQTASPCVPWPWGVEWPPSTQMPPALRQQQPGGVAPGAGISRCGSQATCAPHRSADPPRCLDRRETAWQLSG
jgi:hypothetical protein